VAVQATDPVTRAGIAAFLDDAADLAPSVLPPAAEGLYDDIDVVVVVDDPAVDLHESLQHTHQVCPHAHIVLVAGSHDPINLFSAVDCGLAAIIPRAEATRERLTRAVRSAGRGEGDLPAATQGRLLDLIRHLQRTALHPHGLGPDGLERREADVLRLVANGMTTREIGHELSYSERTVKNILHTVMMRLDLRSRAHAVAYAIRTGLI
jgi:DNA-binding NarL/FixJ family response regulator